MYDPHITMNTYLYMHTFNTIVVANSKNAGLQICQKLSGVIL